MGKDDWIHKIGSDREAAEEKAALYAKIRLDNRRIYEAKADGFWSRFAAEIERLVAIYNAGPGRGQDNTVRIERDGQHGLSVALGGVAVVQVHINNQAQELSVMRRFMRPDGGRSDEGPMTQRIAATAAGEVTLENATLDDYARNLLEPFFRRINGLK